MSTVEEFKNNKYVIVRNAIDRSLINFVSNYALFDEMQNFSPEGEDAQVPAAHSRYADPAMEAMLIHLQPQIESITGLSVYPTYSYYRVYRNNDTLEPHIDRPSCEISATLCFNFSYEKSDFRWPIYIEGRAVDMEPGDLVVYRGIDLEHWREELIYPEKVWHVQAFLHYVDVDGPHSEYKFDGRTQLGLKHPNDQKNNNSKKSIDNSRSNKSYLIWT